MPLREDLLEPIAGDNPSGISMRYERVYDQIKEARAEDDDTLPAGAWERQAKRADSTLVIKLAGEVLVSKSKDLQIAAWLGEAHIKKEGAGQLVPVLTLLLDLQREFWETIYPEIDEGDAGLRAVPVQWAANRYATLVYQLPLTKGGINFYSYKSGRALGYAADAEDNAAKQEARSEAVGRGQSTAEDIDEGIAGSPKSFYANLDPILVAAQEKLEEMALFCEEKYGDDGPSFRKLRDSLDEVRNLVHTLLADKRKEDPDPVDDEAPEPEQEDEEDVYSAEPAAQVAAAPASRAPKQSAGMGGGVPTSWDDAAARVHACAAYMADAGPMSPVPYLLHTALRWGELREHAPEPPLELLVAPPAAIRSGLKLAAVEENWSAVLATAMQALAEPCARCWLDVHRYLWNATRQMGYDAFTSLVVSQVQGLLKDFPDITGWTFADDTPVGNAETLKWIAEEVAAPAMEGHAEQSAYAYRASPAAEAPDYAANGEAMPDVFEEASMLAGSGQLHAATAMLTRDALTQSSGRMRSQRRVEIAELCLRAGNSPVAASILRDVVTEMEQRRLETWETPETVVRPLALLLRCTPEEEKTAEWEARFARLCALDPGAALEIPV